MNAYQFAFTKSVRLQIAKGVWQTYSMAMVMDERIEDAIGRVRALIPDAEIRSVSWLNTDGVVVIPNGPNPFVIGDENNVEEGRGVGEGDSRSPERLVGGEAGGKPGVLENE
jgi:hypothetical protein